MSAPRIALTELGMRATDLIRSGALPLDTGHTYRRPGQPGATMTDQPSKPTIAQRTALRSLYGDGAQVRPDGQIRYNRSTADANRILSRRVLNTLITAGWAVLYGDGSVRLTDTGRQQVTGHA